MAIKKGKKRVCIQVSDKMHKWLTDSANELEISISSFCKWMIKKNIKTMQSWKTQEDLDRLIKIARTPWIIDDEEEEDDD